MRKYSWIISGFLGFLLVFSNSDVFGQADRSKEADQLLQGMMSQFKTGQSLSFDISYRYSLASKPQVFLDSLRGTFRSSQGRTWYRLDSTETLLAKELTVIVFHEDQLIYLSRPSPMGNQMNPAALLDSMLLKYKGMKATASGKPGSKVLHLEMPEGSSYRKIDYYFGKTDFFPKRVMCLVPAKALLDPALQPNESAEEWAWVEVTFQNVRTGPIGDEAFAVERYVIRKDKEYVPTSMFSQYRVFIGAPELNN